MNLLRSTAIIISIAASAYCSQKHFVLDSLPFGSGIDLDSGSVITIDRNFHYNPYSRYFGSSYDSMANYDIAWMYAGLLWCYCDGYNLFSFFPSYEIKSPWETIRHFTAQDTLDLSKAAALKSRADSMYLLNQSTTTTLVYLVKTNKSNWAIIKVSYIKQLMVICELPAQNCTSKIRVEWWLQDNGSLFFSDLTSAKRRSEERHFSAGNNSGKYPIVNLKGQRVKISHKNKVSALEDLKKGVVVPKK